MSDPIKEGLAKRKAEDSLRSLKTIEGLVDFSSNDYLGFARSTELASQIQHDLSLAAVQNGSTGSRLLTGNSAAVEQLEKQIASFHGSEAALVYSSGYLANIGAVTCMAGRTDTVLYDELIHASIRDGIRLSNAKAYSFAHNDLDALEEKLGASSGNVIVIVESIYSMDGDGPDLKKLAEICDGRADLLVDEAHAIGVAGEHGEGVVHSLSLTDKIKARVVTFGKALGLHGAAVLCSSEMREYMINYSRPFIYTTALPNSSIIAIKNAYLSLPNTSDKRLYISKIKKLFKENIEVKDRLVDDHELGLVVGVLCPGNTSVKLLSKQLAEKGYDVRPILAPTVPEGGERIRVCFHAFNSEDEVVGLANCINEFLR